MVTISVITVAATLSVVATASFIQGSKLSQSVRITQAALLAARSRAIATRTLSTIVFYHHDSLAVPTNEFYEPAGDPIRLPDPIRFVSTRFTMSPTSSYNVVAPGYYIKTVTFFPDGSAAENLSYWVGHRYYKAGGAIVIAVVDGSKVPWGWYTGHVGYVVSWSKNSISVTASTGWWPGGRGYAVIGNELVAFAGIKAHSGYRAQFTGVTRGVGGTATQKDIMSQPVYCLGLSGVIVILGPTGQVIVNK